MTRSIIAVILLFLGFALNAAKNDPEYLNARRNGGELRMMVPAVGDDGNAVSNASVRVLMGMNFREKASRILPLSPDGLEKL